MDTVRGTLGQFTGNRNRGSRGRGGLAQASGFIGGLLSGGDSGGRSRARRRR